MKSIAGALATILGVSLISCCGSSAGGGASETVKLQGAGASFPAPIYSKWFDTYSKMKGVQINYQSVGSGAGIRQVSAGTVDFGASDGPMSDEQIATYEKDVATVLDLLSPATADIALELLALPDRIRGYGPVKEKAAADAKARHAQLIADLANPPPAPRQIAAE